MKFQKGHKKVPGSGRRKGQTCRLAADVRAKLEELGCDPIQGMALLAMDPAQDPKIVTVCYKELAQYCYPKHSSVTLSGILGSVDTKDDTSSIESLKARIAGIASRSGTQPVN